MSDLISLRRISADDYHKMIEANILQEDDRIELINGQIVEMSPIGSKHIACVNKITQVLTGILGDSAIVSVQNPILLSPFSEPEPDFSILRSRDDFYVDRLPEPDDILWLIEISDSSRKYDMEIKLPLYASSGIQQVWIVDLNRSEILDYQQPIRDAYSIRTLFPFDSKIQVPSTGYSILVSKLLP